MWRCSRIMHMQRDLHPTILSSLEGIVDQVRVCVCVCVCVISTKGKALVDEWVGKWKKQTQRDWIPLLELHVCESVNLQFSQDVLRLRTGEEIQPKILAFDFTSG